MSTATAQRPAVSSGNWRAGITGGAVGAIAMGLLILAMNPPTLEVAIPSLYGIAPPPNAGLGMAVHVAHGAALGLAFAAIVARFGVRDTPRLVGLGVAWGVATWAIFAALLMPVWLSAVGSPANLPFPNFAMPSLLWHVVYGLGLGGVYAVLGESR